MTNQFEELLHELGKIFHLELHIDRSHACSIQMGDGLTVQLQPDMSQENLWIFSKLVEIPPGKFRENIFRETLKANALSDPRIAIFGYLANTNHLALFQKYPFAILNGERLAGLIGSFVEMAETWIKALASGQAAPPNPFGPK